LLPHNFPSYFGHIDEFTKFGGFSLINQFFHLNNCWNNLEIEKLRMQNNITVANF